MTNNQDAQNNRESFVSVETVEGTLRGRSMPSGQEFLGIRYGENTAGANRFRTAVPVQPWDGVRDALEFGDCCFQENPDYAPWKDADNGSEDCLNLNVWTPVPTDAAPKPVMVFFHGGALVFGSGSVPMYNGAELAKRGDVVVVTVSHRLHLLGLLYLAAISDEYANDTNLCITDLVEALRWIKRNIRAFGGDPENVTIFGESGGGWKVSSILATPAAKGLFHKAIVQSGSLMNFNSEAAATAATREVLKALDVDETNLKELHEVPAKRLWDVYWEVADMISNKFVPVINAATLPHQPTSSEALALSQDIPTIIGATRDEAVIFVPSLHENTPNTLAEATDSIIQDLGFATNRSDILNYVEHCVNTHPDLSLTEASVRAGSDLMFGIDAVRQAEIRSEACSAPTYFYRFDAEEPMYGGRYATHALELVYIFDKFEFDGLWGEDDLEGRREAADPSGNRFALRDAIIEAWSSFARTGVPVSASLPAWPEFDANTMPTMILDVPAKVVTPLHGDESRQIWNPIHWRQFN